MDNKTILFFDTNHVAIRCLFAGHGQDWNTNDFSFHKHLMLNTIIGAMKKFNADEVVLAIDDVRNWRKKVYKEYKGNRKKVRDSQDFDWKAFFKYYQEFLEELKRLPFKILRIPFCEADDIVAVLAKHQTKSLNIIVASDKDYIQLLQYKQNKLFDPIKRKFITDSDPQKTLKIQVITGQAKKDNIPPIKIRTGEKTAIKLIETGKLEELLSSNEEVNKNYKRNSLLIDFSKIPNVIQKEILKRYEEYDKSIWTKDFNGWFIKHKLRTLYENLQQNEVFFKKLMTEKDDVLSDIF